MLRKFKKGYNKFIICKLEHQTDQTDDINKTLFIDNAVYWSWGNSNKNLFMR